MRKNKFLILIFVLMLTISVKAEGMIFINIECNKDTLYTGNSITCPVNAYYENVTFDKIEFNYNSNLELNFKEVRSINLNSNAGKVNLVSNSTISSPIFDVATLCNVEIKAPANMAVGNFNVDFTNIKVSEMNNSENVVQVDNTSKTIKVMEDTLPDEEEVDLTLKSITIDGVALEGFSPSKTKYENVYVTKEVVRIVGTANAPDKTIVSGHGDTSIDKDKPTTRVIKVESSDQKQEKTYTLVLVYKNPTVEKSKDNTIKTLELHNGEDKLDFEYDSKKTSFDYKVEGIVEKIKIDAVLNDSKATFVNKFGPREVNLNYGKNKIEVKTKAENGDNKTYTLNITREDNRSTDATLFTLKVNDVVIPLEKDKYEYSVDVKYNVLESNIITTPTSDTSKVEFESNIVATPTSDTSKVEFENITLQDGENTPIVITVTAENGTKQEYRVTINRLPEEESKIVLKNIQIKGYDLPFNVDKQVYDLDVKEEDTKLEIIVDPDSINVEVLGNRDLVNNSTVIIRVTDDNGVNTYTINIHKPEKTSLDIVCYAVFGLGLLTFICSIIYAIKTKKRR